MDIKQGNDRHRTNPYPLRLSPELRQQLAATAVKNRRSLNGEIVYRLEQSRNGEASDEKQPTGGFQTGAAAASLEQGAQQ